MILPVAILGWGVGWLVNYLADVLPIARRLVRPFCLNCRESLSLWNYLAWPRRCTVCKTRRALRVWLVEVGFIAITAWLWLVPSARLSFGVALVLLIYFGVVVVIDMEHHLILHPVSRVGAALGLLVGFWLHGLKATLLGGAAGFAIMFGLYLFGALMLRFIARLRGVSPADEALGFGDVNLSGVLGLILGWPGIVGGILLALFLGAMVSFTFIVIMKLLNRYQPFMAIPYGPVLISSAVILLFFPKFLLSHL